MFEGLIKRVKRENTVKEEIVDLILFFCVFLLSDVLLIPVMGLTSEGEYAINWHDSLPPYLFFPVMIVLVLGLTVLWFRRLAVTEVKPSKWLIVFYLILAVFRIVSVFSYPYVTQELQYSYFGSVFTAKDITFSLYNRFTTLISELYYIGFLFFLYTYLHTFSSRFLTFLRFLFFVLIAVSFVATIYSAITEGSVIVSEWSAFVESGGARTPNILVKSFTSNRNVFGFLLMVTVFACILMMFGEKGSTLFYIPIAYFSFWIIAIFCRTATGLTGLMVVFTMIYYPIRFHRTRPLGSRISLFGDGLLFVTFFAIVFYILGTTQGMNLWLAIHERYLDSTSLDGRFSLNLLGLTMMVRNPYYFIFGYNRCPGDLIFEQLEYQMNPLDPSWCCHNGFLQIWIDEGFIPLLACLSAYGVLIYQGVVISIKKPEYVPTLVIFLALTFYSFLEPRAMFMKEGSTVILLAIMLLPIRYYYMTRDQIPVVKQDTDNHGRYWE